MKKPIENKPIPTKYDEGENALIRVLAARSGLPVAVIVRRCVRLLGAELKKRGRAWNWMEETAEPYFDTAILREFAEIRAREQSESDEAKQWLDHAKGKAAEAKSTRDRGKQPPRQ